MFSYPRTFVFFGGIVEFQQTPREACELFVKLSNQLVKLKSEGCQAATVEPSAAECTAKRKAELKLALDKALPTLKNAKAKEALKTVHVAVVLVASGRLRSGTDSDLVFAQRMRSNVARLEEALERFEIER